MARRSQCSSAGDNPLDPNYLPPHYREEYRLAVDALVEEDLEGYYQFLQRADVVDFLSTPEIQYIQSSIRVPQLSSHPEQHFLEVGGDGSSDTYWPVHSDLDVPGLDLGWPQLHHFIGPAEVTTLVNPPEPDMPSIKEQARRLIKNAQQVIAVVMDMFTDVDMFSDIINAAMRNVAVYIILDEQNAHHFLNMVSSCRVNLQSIQFMRVRTVSGITYQCRSGKSFKGQMMDRFLLTDCRAVLSGNYSFMWSFEKLHRCMAHLFLGQLVSTFDEEFRILYAQSQPLVVENVMAPMEDLSLLQKRQYPSDRTSLYRDTRKFLSMDTGHPDEWARHPHDDRVDGDWRMMALKRQESLRGPADMYGRFPPQQARMDPPFDPGHSRIAMLENPAFKRHSYAEGVQGRYSHPFLQQQGMPDSELPGRHLHRGQQQPYPGHGAGPEPEYGGYDKFWNQGYLSADQHSEPSGLPQEMQPPDNFDTVRNYLSSTRNLDVDQTSEKLPPADLPFSSSHPRRLSLGQVYTCQTSPTPSNPTDQKDFFQEPSTDRKDPLVKRGLRNWRISSYLSAYDNPEEEGLPQVPLQPSDPFEEPSNPIQQTAPGIDSSLPKIPNVREFKVPMIPRASQMPSYAKITPREQPKKFPDEPSPAVATEITTSLTPSDSSSTTEGEKTEEIEPKEAKTPLLRRDDSFRRKYNAAVPKSSRLRSSLIFSSLDQQQTPQDPKTATGDQQEEEGEKTEADQTKLPFVSHVLGQRRSAAREPFQWTRYLKSATIDTPSTETSKPDDDGSSKDKNSSKEESSKDLSENTAAQESLKPPDVEQAKVSPSLPQLKPPEAELPKPEQPMQPSRPLLTTPLYVDMNDPDARFMFFKELAAKRKAAKAAEAEKSKEKAPMKTPADPKGNTDVEKEETVPKETPENKASASEGSLVKNAAAESPEKTVSTESVSPSLDICKETKKQDSLVKNDPKSSQSFKEEQTKVTTDTDTIKKEENPSAAILPEAPQSKSAPEHPNLSSPAVKQSDTSHPPTPTDATPADVSSPAQDSDETGTPSLDSTSKESVEVPVLSVTSAAPPPPSSEQDTGSECSSSNPAVKSPSTDPTVPDSGSQNSSSPSSSAPPSTPVETKSSNITPEDSHASPASSIPSPKVDKTEAQESVSSSSQESSKPAVETLQKTENLSDHTNLETVSQKTSSESPSAVDCAHVESDIPPDTCAAGSEPNTSSSESDTKTGSEDISAATPSEKDSVKDASESVKDISESKKDASESETHSLPKTVAEESEVLTPSKDVKADSTSATVAPSAPDSDVPAASGLEISASKTEPKEATPPLADSPPEHLPSETSSPVSTDSASQSETTATAPEAPPSDLSVTGGDALAPAETQSLTPPPNESVGSVLSPEAEKTETNTSALQSLTDTDSLSKEAPPESDKAPVNPSAKSPSGPTEPTSTVPTEVDLPPCKTPETVTSESHAPEPPVPAENSQIEPEGPDPGEKESVNPEDMKENHKGESQESVGGEKPNDQVKQNNCSEPTEVTSKQPKSNQSRYHSSTANVLSSSNLRDDTKLLLEKISANSQSRSEATKESPVTDDEKEDEADKNAKREKERGISTFNRGQPKSTQEREKLLERIQSIRKERKVYSRFEV